MQEPALQMTPEKVQQRVEKIERMSGDSEAAHSEEDELYADVLRSIAAGKIVDAQTCAKIALSTQDMSFARWCA